ncbi:zinc finger protein ZAT3 [Momordica charantia]|uniref:Zinc finger protein ZAT3 n=1 Tax=Momordica charantia TaxID=3673 RepID=A0A6J1CFB7_MOMCH|nr:zinc finger protein ZAT3 [Momordica charantia]
MDTDSDSLFHFNVFRPASAFVAAAAASTSAVAAQNCRRKRTKLIKMSDHVLAPSSSGGIAKPKYGKKPDPSAPKITRPCSECGKKFWSWKALFGHMRCHPERQWRGINPPPNLRRSSETATATEEDHEIAACLIMLANGPNAIDRTTEAVTETDQESEPAVDALSRFMERTGPPFSRFECSRCKKSFGSHQALGGHRASHKNVKGCFAGGRTDGGEFSDAVEENGETANECRVCMKVMKRRHWEKEDEEQQNSSVGKDYLDLNLPPPMEDVEETSSYFSGIVLDLRLGL